MSSEVFPALSRHLPPEITSWIFEFVMVEDRVALILPQPMFKMSVQHTQGEDKDDHHTHNANHVITSVHPLHCLNKEARAIYNALFRAKALKLDLREIIATVEDLNFDYLFDDFIARIRDPVRPWFTNSTRLYGSSAYNRFTVSLVFTGGFLASPDHERINRWLEYMNDDKKDSSGKKSDSRKYSIHYYIDSVPGKYVDGLQGFCNYFVLERLGEPGPELAKFMQDVGEAFMSNQIYKYEGEKKVYDPNGIIYDESDDERVGNGPS